MKNFTSTLTESRTLLCACSECTVELTLSATGTDHVEPPEASASPHLGSRHDVIGPWSAEPAAYRYVAPADERPTLRVPPSCTRCLRAAVDGTDRCARHARTLLTHGGV